MGKRELAGWIVVAALAMGLTAPAAAEEGWEKKVQQMQEDDTWCPPVVAHLLPHFVDIMSQEAEKNGEIPSWVVRLFAGIDMMDNSNHVKQAFLAMGCALLLPSLKQSLTRRSEPQTAETYGSVDLQWLDRLMKRVPGLNDEISN